LFHNPSAGSGSYTLEELVHELRKAGHEVSAYRQGDGSLDEQLRDPGTVVVAGGDGSVRRIALHLVDRDVPIAVLPVGTANNIARSLGLPRRDPIETIRRLDDLAPTKYDVGHIQAPWGRGVFLEGAGFGPSARAALLLSHPSQQELFEDPNQQLVRDRALLAEVVRHYAAQDAEIELDNERVAGQWLAVHIMNLPSIGPNLEIAPAADPRDGLFDVALIEDKRRREFADFLSRPPDEQDSSLFPVRRSRSVRLRWSGAEVHVDDELHQVGQTAELKAHVLRSALTFLVRHADGPS
jgi:diacylglycerol kinase family enzyme